MLTRLSSRESIVAVGLGLLLFWAPLPAGSVRPADQLILRLIAFGLVTVALSEWSRCRWRRCLPVAALATVALLGLVQSCRWPASVAAVVSPEHVELYGQAAELLGADGQPPPEPAVRLSLDAAASRSAALSWLAAASLLAAALFAGGRVRHRRWMLAALVAASLIQIAWGLMTLHGTVEGGLGAALLRPEGRLRGTFANPNHLSLLLEIAMAAVAAWTWVEMSRLRRLRAGRRARALLPPVLWLVLLGAVVATGSRAGLAAAVLGGAAQLMALPFAGRGRRAGAAAALVFVVGLGAIAALGSRVEIRRYATVSLFETNLRSRLLLVPPALDLWQRFPLAGTGLGTFEDSFAMVATSELTPVLWNRAHNDPLELLVTGGLAGFALGLVALASFLSWIWRALRSGERLEDRAAALAAVGALAAAGFHELFDFGLVIPANSLALLAVLGAAGAVGNASSPAERPRA